MECRYVLELLSEGLQIASRIPHKHSLNRIIKSVGTSEITRQITNVAAGTYDTDAVNVAQLMKGQKGHRFFIFRGLKLRGA